MSVTMKRRNPSADVASMAEIVPFASGSEHDDWIEFLRQNDGGVPELNVFEIGSDNGSGVSRFFSVAEARLAYSNLADRMPPDVLPVADAEGGNYLCLGLSPTNSGVLFWDHETEAMVCVARSFGAFLEALRPFDPDSVELRPGQVISAWIDPALLESETRKK